MDNGSIRGALDVCQIVEIADKNSLSLGDYGFSTVGGRRG